MVSLAALVGGEEGEEHEEVLQHGRAVAGGQHLREAVGAAAVAAAREGPGGLCVRPVRGTREAAGRPARRMRPARRPLVLLPIGGWRRRRPVPAAAVSAPPPS